MNYDLIICVIPESSTTIEYVYIYIFKYTYKWQSLASYSTLYIMYMFQRMLIDAAQYKVVPHG